MAFPSTAVQLRLYAITVNYNASVTIISVCAFCMCELRVKSLTKLSKASFMNEYQSLLKASRRAFATSKMSLGMYTVRR